MNGFKLEKREILYALIGVIVLLTWFLIIKDLLAPFLSSIPPFFSALIYHAGFYIGVFLIATILTSAKTQIKASFIAIIMLAGIDIIDAPYVVSKTGIINKGIEYWFTTYDAMFASLLNPIIHGYWLWVSVYIIIPFILIFVIPIIIAYPKVIKKILGF